MSRPLGPLSVDEARRCIVEHCSKRRTGNESVPLAHAIGRILAGDLKAARNLPPFANSAMDGFAVRAEDLPAREERALRIVGTRLAGSMAEVSVGPGECVRITTGAVLPAGADTVVIKERVRVEGTSIVVSAGEIAGANVRAAGEDFCAGAVVARRGERIGIARLAAIASLGLAEVEVARRPRAALLTTGDELVLPGQVCAAGQIYNSNGYSLSALLARAGAESLVQAGADDGFLHVRDDREQIRDALRAASRDCAVIVTSGGISAGEADYLSGLVEDIGRIVFWKVRMRPGMPFLFGEIGNALVFCLPGNPVSTLATFLCLVEPALAELQGSSEVFPRVQAARLATPIDKRHERTEFLRAVVEIRDDGSAWARPVSRQGSGMIGGIVDANCLLRVSESTRHLDSGEMVEVLPLPEYF